jgi:Spy/CpxP family protein refolding chaperone
MRTAMKIKNNQRTTNIALIVLVIMNIGLMIILWLGAPPPPPNPKHATRRAIDILDLNPQQAEQFRQLERRHFEQTKVLVDSVRDLRNTLVAQVDQGNQVTQPLALKIGELEGQITVLLVQHYDALAQQLNPEQQAKLKQLFERRFLQPKLPPRRKQGPTQPD